MLSAIKREIYLVNSLRGKTETDQSLSKRFEFVNPSEVQVCGKKKNILSFRAFRMLFLEVNPNMTSESYQKLMKEMSPEAAKKIMHLKIQNHALPMRHFPNLYSLNIEENTKVDQENLKVFLRLNPQLKELKMSCVSTILKNIQGNNLKTLLFENKQRVMQIHTEFPKLKLPGFDFI